MCVCIDINPDESTFANISTYHESYFISEFSSWYSQNISPFPATAASPAEQPWRAWPPRVDANKQWGGAGINQLSIYK